VLLDATVGAGGHSARFLEACGAACRIVGLDRDPEMIERARARLEGYGARVTLAVTSFGRIDEVLDRLGVATVDAALFDLGANSLHFDRPERGFSFLSPGPLDMRYDRTGGPTAADIVNDTPEPELARILTDLGDETRARKIARAIAAERPISDTLRLADVVERAIGRGGRVHSATRTFQALRMAVNRELDEVEMGIPAAVRRLSPGGRLVVLSFHSGEDRLIKRLLRAEVDGGRARLLTKKPLRPDREETRANPRSRSAMLRAVERVGEGQA
jgi:16S rRNA (cytosine1402-N4)-methyltransferase